MVKLFLKRPDKAQGLVQRVLQAATAENDNPDVRDRAYIYWRLLSNTSDQNATKSIVLSEKPPIVTTIHSLPPTLLEQLLQELSTLSSVYHKPPEQFVGQGRFGADAVQRAAIQYASILVPSVILLMLTFYFREQIENARENPLAAAAAAAAVTGETAPAPAQNNVENLLDIDFDGGAPASAQQDSSGSMSGLEGLAGTPVRVQSPAAGAPAPQASNNLDDLLGVFGDSGPAQPSSSNANGSGAANDLMNGFDGLDLSGNTPPPANNQQPKKTNEDIMSLF